MKSEPFHQIQWHGKGGRMGGNHEGVAKMGVKFRTFGISKIFVTRVKYRFVDFYFRRKGALATALLL